MEYQEMNRRLRQAIADEREAQAVGRLVVETALHLSWADALCGGLEKLTVADDKRLETIVRRIEQGEPVQYAIGQAPFYGRLFEVSPAVLIPRPETEELCQWILTDEHPGVILDIGTGSGCIAITLALGMPEAHIHAIDISEDALAVAQQNARRLHAPVSFHRMDILAWPDNSPSAISSPWGDGRKGILVSNPPYITEHEKSAMEPHVLQHEPHQALFVPDDDPLLFYRAIAQKANHLLAPSGTVYFEINPLYTTQLCDMLTSMNFQQITVRKDSFGRERFLRASLPPSPNTHQP